jgi:hypothetical protein
MIPLGMHIAERGRDKNPNGFPGCGHQAITPKDDRVNRVSNGFLIYSSLNVAASGAKIIALDWALFGFVCLLFDQPAFSRGLAE